jgi:hypothetical protein
MIALLATGTDMLHLGIGRGYLPYLLYKILTGDYYHLVHQWRAMKGTDAMLEHGASVNLQKLLGTVGTKTTAASSCQKYGYVHDL